MTVAAGLEPVMIPLTHIIPDPQYQPRSGGVVESHTRLLMEGDPTSWPPCTVAPDGEGRYLLIDGFHRHEAALRLGLASLPCVVQEGAGYLDGVAANIAHGLPLIIQDRKEAARQWIEDGPTLSDREVGRRVGLSPTTVGKVRKSGSASIMDARRPAPDPLDRWLRQTSKLDSPPRPHDVKSEIDAYAEDDRAEVARFYEMVGKALLTASAPYLRGR